jgi:antitoxin CptB
MRELDALLERFLAERYPELDEQGRAAFEALLELQDPELHAYVLGRAQPEDPAIARIVAGLAAPRRA